MIAKSIFMIRPGYFGFNPETAENNVFQQQVVGKQQDLQASVLREFDAFVEVLRTHKIIVDILHDNPAEKRLDAIFSNNWFSTHPDQTLVTYPLFSPIRRKERDPVHIQHIIDHYQVLCHLSLEHYEHENLFLEGTGSLIIDHEYGVVYGNRSARTHDIPFVRFCRLMGYTPVLFDATDLNGIPVYHTNVVMGIGHGYVLINRSAVALKDWGKLQFYFHQTNKEIIEISHSQMTSYLGNSAYIHNSENEPYIIMSENAYHSLKKGQKEILSRFGTILYVDISTIETIGGGSTKCMITENYLKRR